jgi:hypothetical protein
MLSTRRIFRAVLPCVIACALAAPAISAAQSQDLRSPDARDSAPTSSLAGTPSPDSPWQDLRPPDVRDASVGRGTADSPDVTVVKLAQPAPVTAADGGIDWADAGIGAAILLGAIALALIVAKGATQRRRRTATAA